MRVLGLSDIHNDIDYLKKLPFSSVDVVIMTGDIITYESYMNELKDFVSDALFIPGNNDPINFCSFYTCVNKKRVDIGRYNVVGLGFSLITPFNTLNEMTEQQFQNELSQLKELVDKNTIFLTHNPPYGIFDYVNNLHLGSKSILSFVKNTKPRIHMFGHVHELKGFKQTDNTLFVKLPPPPYYTLIDVDNLLVTFHKLDYF